MREKREKTRDGRLSKQRRSLKSGLMFLLMRARAALVLLGIGESELVGDLEKSGHSLGDGTVLLDVGGGSHLDGSNHVLELVAAAALRLAASGSGALVANEVALGLGAGGGLSARPRALGSRASGSAVGDGGGADSLALSGQANVLAKRATVRLAVLAGATNFTLGLFTTNITCRLGQLLASEFTSRLLTLRFTNSGAGGGITLPLAIREARALCTAAYLLKAGSISKSDVLSSDRSYEKSKHQKDSHFLQRLRWEGKRK